jgi:AcrR family transcriptional regulator
MERKEMILETALRLFSEQGYDTTPTRQIAKGAGVSEGLIFRHFGTKEGLMDALLERGNERLGKYINSILELPQPRSRIESSIDLPCKLFTNERAYWALLFSLKWQRSYRKAADREEKYILPLQQSLTEAFAQLKFPNPQREVAVLFVFLEGLSSQLLTQPFGPEMESTIQLMKSKYYQ